MPRPASGCASTRFTDTCSGCDGLLAVVRAVAVVRGRRRRMLRNLPGGTRVQVVVWVYKVWRLIGTEPANPQ